MTELQTPQLGWFGENIQNDFAMNSPIDPKLNGEKTSTPHALK